MCLRRLPTHSLGLLGRGKADTATARPAAAASGAAGGLDAPLRVGGSSQHPAPQKRPLTRLGHILKVEREGLALASGVNLRSQKQVPSLESSYLGLYHGVSLTCSAETGLPPDPAVTEPNSLHAAPSSATLQMCVPGDDSAPSVK